jgi:hypothetical protein
MSFDYEHCHQAATTICAPGGVHEVRIPKTSDKRVVSGYFDDPEQLAREVAPWSSKVPGVYMTLNPCDPAHLERVDNTLHPYVTNTTNDSQILLRRWLAVDYDPQRPSEISSTDAQHEAAIEWAQRCRDWLRGQGWPPPILADSGNGAHLLYRVDLPNDEDATRLIKGCLKMLAERFNDEGKPVNEDDVIIKVDTSVANSSRIWKLYGTMACKGDSTRDRPHRMARILDNPDKLEVAPCRL